MLNLIHLSDERSYARYGVAVSPALRAVGGRLLWMGYHERSLLGESQAERLMVVRYPSHRRFLAMTMNPYYVMINRLRERGVRRFEASFTYAEERPLPLSDQPWLVSVHFDGRISLEELRELVEPQVGPLVYASRQVAEVSILRGRRATDPNPLTYPRTAMFAADENVNMELGRIGDGAASLYRRVNPRVLVGKAR